MCCVPNGRHIAFKQVLQLLPGFSDVHSAEQPCAHDRVAACLALYLMALVYQTL